MKLLIGCLTAWQFTERRRRCLFDWWPYKRWPDVDAVFIFGQPNITETERQDRCLFVPCSNEYRDLPLRMCLFWKWAAQQHCDWILKIDDDARMMFGRMMDYVRDIPDSAQVVGYPIEDPLTADGGSDTAGRNLDGLTLYPSGNGYFVRHNIAALLASEMSTKPRADGGEDRVMGRVLRKHNIPVHWERERFHILAKPKERPTPENCWVYCSPAEKEPV